MTLYLIAHKVRGQPAFDIAEQMEVEGEIWWIVPTSGHRAHPYWYELIEPRTVPDMPDDLEDHYEVRAQPKAEPPAFLRALLRPRVNINVNRRGL